MGFEVVDGLADGPVSAVALALLKHRERGVDANPEHVEMADQRCELIGPTLGLHYVLDDEVVSRRRKGGD